MGAGNTKIDSATIRKNVTKLEERLKTNDTEVNSYFIEQIDKALDVYYAETNDRDFRNVIQITKGKLKALRAARKIPRDHQTTTYWGKDWHQPLEALEKRITHISKQMKQEEISRQQYENHVNNIIQLSQQFDQASLNKKNDKILEGRKRIALFFLELFIRSPLPVITQQEINVLYENFLSSVDNLSKKVLRKSVISGEDDMQRVITEAEPIVTKLSSIIQKLKKGNNELQQQTSDSQITQAVEEQTHAHSWENIASISTRKQSLQRRDQKSLFSRRNKNQTTNFYVASTSQNNNSKRNSKNTAKRTNVESELRQINEILNIHKDDVQTFSAPVNSSEYKQKRNQITNIQEMLRSIPEKNNDIKRSKNALLQKNVQILKDLERNSAQISNKRDEYLQSLTDVENEIKSLDKINITFEEKEKRLRNYENYVKSVNISDKEIEIKKNEINKKIKSTWHQLLWLIKDAIEMHKSIAGKNLSGCEAYQEKRKEIIALENRLNKIKITNPDSEKLKQNLQKDISEIFLILDQKLAEEQEVNKCLQDLDQVDNEIDNIRKSNYDVQTKTNALEGCKTKISKINNSDRRVSVKKENVLKNLDKPTDTFNLKENQQHNLWKIKSQLEKLKYNIHRSQHPLSSKEYETKRNEISSLLENLERVPQKNIDEVNRKSIRNDILQTLKTLDENTRKNGENPGIQRTRHLQNVENGTNGRVESNLNPTMQNPENHPNKKINVRRSKVLVNLHKRVESNKNETHSTGDLNDIKLSLKKIQAEALHFQQPKSSNLYQRKRTEISDLLKKLENIHSSDMQIEAEKSAIRTQGSSILALLNKRAYDNEELKKNLEMLQNINNQIDIVIGSTNPDLSEMLRCVEDYRAKVHSIVHTNEEVHYEKRKLLDKINIFEKNIQNTKEKKKMIHQELSKNKFWKIKSQLYQHKADVHRFKYSAASNEYITKRKEVSKLMEDLNNIPTEWSEEDTQRKILSNNILEILEILDKNAHKNEENEREEINRCLQCLQKIENDVDDVIESNLSVTTKIASLEQLREKINKTKGQDNRTSNKRNEILAKIKKFEDYFKDEEYFYKNLESIKSSIQKYKREVQQFGYTQSSKAYVRKRDEIFNFLQQLESIHIQNEQIKMKMFNIKNEIRQIIRDLDNKAHDNEKINQYLELIQSVDNELMNIRKADTDDFNKLRSLKEWKEKIISINTSDEEVLNDKSDLLKKIEKYEQEFQPNQKLNQQQSNNFSQTAETSDSIDILDLQHHFDAFNPVKRRNDKQSIDFIHEIRKMAESFENEVKTYKGSNYSIEFLVMDEKLMTLLEEIDKVKCQQDQNMLNEKIKAINYIKGLHKQLDQNAYTD